VWREERFQVLWSELNTHGLADEMLNSCLLKPFSLFVSCHGMPAPKRIVVPLWRNQNLFFIFPATALFTEPSWQIHLTDDMHYCCCFPTRIPISHKSASSFSSSSSSSSSSASCSVSSSSSVDSSSPSKQRRKEHLQGNGGKAPKSERNHEDPKEKEKETETKTDQHTSGEWEAETKQKENNKESLLLYTVDARASSEQQALFRYQKFFLFFCLFPFAYLVVTPCVVVSVGAPSRRFWTITPSCSEFSSRTPGIRCFST